MSCARVSFWWMNDDESAMRTAQPPGSPGTAIGRPTTKPTWPVFRLGIPRGRRAGVSQGHSRAQVLQQSMISWFEPVNGHSVRDAGDRAMFGTGREVNGGGWVVVLVGLPHAPDRKR